MSEDIEGSELKPGRFEYSAENPPPLDVLESKVFAVHATPIFPKGGVLKAGARDVSYDRKWDDEPPSFRPTLHFALGELVREHDDFSWDENPYVVVSPLKALEPQLVNVFPNDTFILGDYHLTEGDTLLVPKGTDTSSLPPNVRVFEYNGGIRIRHAVERVIKSKDGWPIRMNSEGTAIGSVAYIEDTEINSADFFRSLFERFPYVSFGTHLNPERGDAFRFGVIDLGLNLIIKTYSDHFLRFGTTQLQLYKSLVEHNLAKLEAFLQAQGLAPEALQVFEEKKQKVAGWMNIIDADLELRRMGKTLNGAPERIQKQIRRRRYNPEKLRQTIDRLTNDLPETTKEEEISSSVLAEMLHGMPPDELKEFIAKNRRAFEYIDLPRFYVDYAVSRWIVVKDKKAADEGLGEILANVLPQIIPQKKRGFSESEIFRSLEEYLTTDSNRLGSALNILRYPAVKKYLTEQFGFIFADDGPKVLEDVLRAHPETRLIFEQKPLQLTEEQQVSYDILKSLGMIDEPSNGETEGLDSFRKANSLASGLRSSRNRLEVELKQITQPMNSARNIDHLLAGTTLRLYELLRRDNDTALIIWENLGLGDQFKRRFPDEQLFWQSSMSLFEIYKILKKDRDSK